MLYVLYIIVAYVPTICVCEGKEGKVEGKYKEKTEAPPLFGNT
jgi:hypothetical protein